MTVGPGGSRLPLPAQAQLGAGPVEGGGKPDVGPVHRPGAGHHGSYGLAIILFSLLVTLVMLPFQMKSKRSMVRMGRQSKASQLRVMKSERKICS